MRSAEGTGVVLVVDDSPDTVRMLTDVLDEVGMTVMVALDGMAAIKIAARLPPDIVLMDAVMPVMDGFESCLQLKKLSGFENIPVIFMTGLSDPEHTVRAFQAGGADYVTKPIVVDAMMARINVHLANARKIRNARLALDAAAQFLVAVDGEGYIVWFTPHAYRLLEERFSPGGTQQLRLPPEVLPWLRHHASNGMQPDPLGGSYVYANGGFQSQISFLNVTGNGEILLRMSDASPQPRLANVRTRFNLTKREAEVLSWLARGKSNRDIAAILALSSRTVDKHVEIIFAKLNVENRTAAAAMILGQTPAG